MSPLIISHRWTGQPLYEGKHSSWREAVEEAVYARTDLSEADLSEVNLREAFLPRAILPRADLSKVDLSGSNLAGADLSKANLFETNLLGANLRGAKLHGTNLREANLNDIREDLHEVLSASPNEVTGLRPALCAGRIDGSIYEGDCVCLVGTLANVRGCAYYAIPGLTPRPRRPAERWFLAIAPGQTPDNDPIAAITAEWIEDWIAAREEATS